MKNYEIVTEAETTEEEATLVSDAVVLRKYAAESALVDYWDEKGYYLPNELKDN